MRKGYTVNEISSTHSSITSFFLSHDSELLVLCIFFSFQLSQSLHQHIHHQKLANFSSVFFQLQFPMIFSGKS